MCFWRDPAWLTSFTAASINDALMGNVWIKGVGDRCYHQGNAIHTLLDMSHCTIQLAVLYGKYLYENINSVTYRTCDVNLQYSNLLCDIQYFLWEYGPWYYTSGFASCYEKWIAKCYIISTDWLWLLNLADINITLAFAWLIYYVAQAN